MRRGWREKTLLGGDAPGEVEPGVVGDYGTREEERTDQGGGYPPPEVLWQYGLYGGQRWRWQSVGRVRLRTHYQLQTIPARREPLKQRHVSRGRLDPVIAPNWGAWRVAVRPSSRARVSAQGRSYGYRGAARFRSLVAPVRLSVVTRRADRYRLAQYAHKSLGRLRESEHQREKRLRRRSAAMNIALND